MGDNNFSNKSDLTRLGEEIKQTVQDALNSQDFRQLSKDINDSVSSALNEVQQAFGIQKQSRRRTTGNFWDNLDGVGGVHNSSQTEGSFTNEFEQEKQKSWTQKKGKKEEWQKADSSQNQKVEREAGAGQDEYGRKYKIVRNAHGKYVRVLEEADGTGSAAQLPAVIKKPGKGKGICLSGLGIIGIAVSVGLGAMAAATEAIFTGAYVLIPLFFLSMALYLSGTAKLRLVRRFQDYISQIKGKGYCSIEVLAQAVGKKKKFIIRDLQKMISMHYFPQGHLDDEKTCFILDDKTYQAYEDMRKYQEEVKKDEEEARARGMTEEARAMILEGREYVRQIKEANEAIIGEAFSEKLYRLESVTSEIFDFIEEHPGRDWDIHRFMEYYLPTVLKLVQAYRDFDSQLVEGENISAAKHEIENTLGTINGAFEQLLDRMFEEAAMDVSTDISTLEVMLAQDGLIKNEFRKNGRKEE